MTKTVINTTKSKLGWVTVLLAITLAAVTLAQPSQAQDQNQDQEDPPSRVARLGFMQGSVSFQPAGESDWVQAVSNRPMTTGDQLWADQNSRAEVELGSSVIRLTQSTGFSFLNLNDNTIQIQLTSGAINIHVRDLNDDDVYEIDTPNQAFTITQPGIYRIEASEDGTYTVISVREGRGESTGNGQTYTVHAGQRATFSGTDSLNADVDDIGGMDPFDTWVSERDHRYENSRSAAYVSRQLVGYEDLDENGDWRDDANYGHVWYPRQVSAGWAPYREGHWDWIAPWGWTWVDDFSWGYAPFHYGRWVTVGGRWGWIAGPVAVRPVYAPALVVFVGGTPGFGGNVAWFPLGPREVFVPSYHVSAGYVNRVNITNTTVNVTQVTNVYNTTIINRTTNVTNITYVNRNVQGAVTAVPQRTFSSAQPVGRAVVQINARELASARMTTTAAVAPSRDSVLGARSNTAGRVSAPPAAVMNRQVIARTPPPPPPVPFARQQQALAANPGQPLARREMQTLRPPVAAGAPARPTVRVAPPSKPAAPITARPGNQPNGARPGQPGNPMPNQPGNRPAGQPTPNERPGATNPATNNPAQPNNRPEPNRPNPNQPGPGQPATNNPAPNRPQPNQPTPNPNNQPAPNRPAPNQPPANQPTPAQPAPNRPGTPEPRNERPPVTTPNQPEPNRPQPNRPETQPVPPPTRPATPPNRPAPDTRPDNRPDNRPAEPPARTEPAPRPPSPAPADRPPQRTTPPAQARPQTPPPQNKPTTAEEKKRQDEERKRNEKPQ
jgi:hypothetical protein